MIKKIKEIILTLIIIFIASLSYCKYNILIVDTNNNNVFSGTPSLTFTNRVNVSNDLSVVGDFRYRGTNLTTLLAAKVSTNDPRYLASLTNAWQNMAGATNWTWTSDGIQITLETYTGPNEVHIPNMLDGLPVTTLKQGLFQYKSSITSVSGGENISRLEPFVFNSCSSLASIDLPKLASVEGSGAFQLCTSLTSINLHNVALVGSPFTACPNLTAVYFSGNAPPDWGGAYTDAPNVTNYVTNPMATGWGTTWNGRPVVRLPVYADEYWRLGTNLTTLLDGKVPTNDTRYLAALTNISIILTPGLNVTINGESSPVTLRNGDSAIISSVGGGGGSGGGISNMVVNNVWGTLYGSGSNVYSSVTLVPSDIGAITTNQLNTATNTIWVTVTDLNTITAINTTNYINGVANNLTNLVNGYVPTNDARYLGAWQNPSTASDWTWTKTETEVTLTGYTGPSDVVIPDMLDGLPVTGFGTMFGNNTSITTVTGGANIKTIGGSAFSGCTFLTSVSLLNAVTIGNASFYSCESLTSVSLPNVTTIGGSAFYDCYALTSVSLPNATTIGFNAFRLCISLASVSLPAAVTIGSAAFRDCDDLSSVSLPAATTIGTYVFHYCDALTSVSIPNATTIGNGAFYGDTSLTAVYFAQNAPTPASNVYLDSPNVTNYVTNPTATGWGTTWNGRPVVRLPVYSDAFVGNGAGLTNITATQIGAVPTNDARYLAALTNISIIFTPGLNVTINGGSSPVTLRNGDSATIASSGGGGGSGGGLSNIVVNNVWGTLYGSGSNVYSSVTLVPSDIGAITTNQLNAATNTIWVTVTNLNTITAINTTNYINGVANNLTNLVNGYVPTNDARYLGALTNVPTLQSVANQGSLATNNFGFGVTNPAYRVDIAGSLSAGSLVDAKGRSIPSVAAGCAVPFDGARTWTTRTSATDNDWYSVCWSPELRLFVALAYQNESASIMTSHDGILWTSHASLSEDFWSDVCWSPELRLFVAVASTAGTGNRVMTSPDGIAWTAHAGASESFWISVCWSPELRLFVAVGAGAFGPGNRVMTSPNGTTWTIRTGAANNTWRSVCWSPELRLFVAVSSSGTGNRVMTSPDGITWTTRTSATDNDWYNVCWSPELRLFVAVANTGTGDRVMTSPDGTTWTSRTSATDNNWNSVCWSPELRLFVAVSSSGTGDRVMTSLDGITWTSRTSATDNDWQAVCWSPELRLFSAVSSSGTGDRVMTAGVEGSVTAGGGFYGSGANLTGITATQVGAVPTNDPRYLTTLTNYQTGTINLGTGTDFVSRVTILDQLVSKQGDGTYIGRDNVSKKRQLANVGETWTAKESNRAWVSLSLSSDGKYQTAIANSDQIYISSDYGNSWTNTDTIKDWVAVSISSDGKYQTAISAGDNIYISSDYGNTWTNKDSNRDWQSVSVSADGKYQTAVVYGGQIYVSLDYGNNWTNKDSNKSWQAVAISSDGKYQTAIAHGDKIYISSDYGNSWTNKGSSRNWYMVSMSADGKYQTVVGTSSQIQISSDYGNTWIPKDSSRSWQSVCISADGKYQIAAVMSGQIYISLDYGNNWTPKDSNRSWQAVAISSDGKYLIAAENVGQIYVSRADDIINSGLIVDGSLNVSNNIYMKGNLVLTNYQTSVYLNTINPPNGFENQTNQIVSFNPTTRQAVVAPVGSSFRVTAGYRTYTYNNAVTSSVGPNVAGGLFAYFRASDGEFICTNTPWAISGGEAQVIFAYLDTNTPASIVFTVDERHGVNISDEDHLMRHLTVGSTWASGMTISHFGADSATAAGANGTNTCIAINDAGIFYDEDVRHTTAINGSNGGATNTAGIFPILYKTTTGSWRKREGTWFPFAYSGNIPTYWNSAGVETTVAEDLYFVYWLVAYGSANGTNLFLISHPTTYSSTANAQSGATFANFSASIGGLPATEMLIAYRLIFQFNASGGGANPTSVKSAKLRSVDDYRNIPGGVILAGVGSGSGSYVLTSDKITDAGGALLTDLNTVSNALNDKITSSAVNTTNYVALTYVNTNRTITIDGVTKALDANVSFTTSGGSGTTFAQVTQIVNTINSEIFWVTNTVTVSNSLDYAIPLVGNNVKVRWLAMFLSATNEAATSKAAEFNMYTRQDRLDDSLIYSDTNQLYWAAPSSSAQAVGATTGTVADASGIVKYDRYAVGNGTQWDFLRATNANTTTIFWSSTNKYATTGDSNTKISHANYLTPIFYDDDSGQSSVWCRLAFNTPYTGTVTSIIRYSK